MTPPASAAARPRGARSGTRAARRPPRRYSGPAGGYGATASAAAVAVAVPATTLPARPRPRRQAPRSQPRRAHLRIPLGSIALPAPRDLLALALRGRTWIGIVAVGLIGLVTMQLMMLELNTSIGSSLRRAAALQRENDSLAIGNSEAGSGESVEALARGLGMIGVAPGELHFVHAVPLTQAGRVADMLGSTSPFAPAGIGSSSIGGSAAGASGYVTSPGGETPLSPASQESLTTAGTSTGSTAASAQAAGAEEAAAAGTTAGEGTSGGGAAGQGASTAAAQGSQSASGIGQGTGAAGEAGEPAASVSAGGGTQAGAGG